MASTPPGIFPRNWLRILRSTVAHYRLLSRPERRRLCNDIQTFIAGKYWEGCRGLIITDEIKVTIAAEACLMLLGHEHDCFRHVRTILVYPSGFRPVDQRLEEAGWVRPIAAAGLAFHRGPVVLAWDRALADARDPSRGYNLVIHEFAHQLDLADGYADATFDLPGKRAGRWEAVLNEEFQSLRRNIRRGQPSFFSDYAAKSKTEFFARASERFFTRPADFRHYHSELYAMFVQLYALDPEKWFAPRG
jgi:Mlc titration factor MtfA (ptsG expression regulator)